MPFFKDHRSSQKVKEWHEPAFPTVSVGTTPAYRTITARVTCWVRAATAAGLLAITMMLAGVGIGPAGAAPTPPGTLYITEFGAGMVVSLPVSGGTPTTVTTGLNRPCGVAVQPGPPACSGSVCLPSFGSSGS